MTRIPKLIIVLLLMACCIYADGITRSPQGLLQVENLTFGLSYWSLDRKNFASQVAQPNLVQFLGEGGTETPEGIRRTGTFKVSEFSQFHYEETVRQTSANQLKLTQVLLSDQGIPTSCLALCTHMPTKLYMENPPIFNGKRLESKLEKELKFPQANNELILNLDRGRLVITGNCAIAVRLQHQVDVQLKFKAGEKLKHTEQTLHFFYEPYRKSTVIDLKSTMNMGFRDAKADDQIGGWTDQGPDKDLRMMKPGHQNFLGIPFHIINPLQNDGKSCLVLNGPQRPYFIKNSMVSVPSVSGDFLYLLNGLAWPRSKGTPAGKVIVHYADGTKQETILKTGIDTGDVWSATDCPNAMVAWKARDSQSTLGLYATKILLKRTHKVTKLEFHSMNQVWMILAATVSDLSAKRETDQNVIMQPNQNWLPFKADFKTVPGSVADLSFLQDAPAGKYGFLKTVGDHFEFEQRPGIPARFWGAAACMTALFSTRQDNVDMLNDFVAMGYNTIRLHHFDYMITQNAPEGKIFNPQRLDQLDFLLAEAKKRGLYASMDLFTIAHYGTMKQFNLLSKPWDYKLLCYFDPQVRQAFGDVAVALLNHVNPYTGMAWKDDPMFITINLIGEGTLTARKFTGRGKTAAEKAFKRYLEKNHLTTSKNSRKLYWNQFLEATGIDFFNDLKTRLTKIGLKIPLSDQNFADPALETRAAYDFVDTHLYWAHPIFIGKHTWNLPSFTKNNSAIKASAGGIRDVLHTRFIGHPMTITEWGYCYPNPHNFEGPFLVAAYAALQDYSGLWQFAYSHRDQVAKPSFLGALDFRCNPILKLANRMGTLLFLRKDVQSANTTIAGTRQALRTLDIPTKLSVKIGRFVPGENKADITLLMEDDPLPPAPNMANAIRIKNTTDAREKLQNKKLVAPLKPDGSIVSETGELTISPNQGTFKIVTLKLEALIMNPKQSLAGSVMAVHNGESFAAFALAALDDMPLTQSQRLLLLHLTDVKGQNAVFRDSAMTILEKYGSSDLLLRKNKANIQLNTTNSYRIFACAPNGRRLCEIKHQTLPGKLLFTVDNTQCNGIVLYELIRR